MKKHVKNLITDFELLDSWEEKYEHLISLGNNIHIFDGIKAEKYLIRGCQSKVWLACKYKNGRLYFYGDSDALITRGLVALIIKIYSNARPEEIINEKINFFKTIGLQKHLSMTRANGLNIMLKTINKYALKYLENE